MRRALARAAEVEVGVEVERTILGGGRTDAISWRPFGAIFTPAGQWRSVCAGCVGRDPVDVHRERAPELPVS